MPTAPTESDRAAGPQLITRFAPSPTGRLHAGHAFSALTAFDWARRSHGRFLLRIENIDAARCRCAFEADILEDLTWLGLRWETPVRRQSEHLETYRAALRSLQSKGLLYRCFRTRRDLMDDIGRAPHETGDAFRGGPLDPTLEAARLAQGDPYAWRLSLDAAEAELGGAFSTIEISEADEPPSALTPSNLRRRKADPRRLGDVVLARKDLGVSYHLACVLDDASQGVTHVVRGEDLRAAADCHRLLQCLLDLPAPIYHHHPLILDDQGRRLSKRAGSRTLQDERAAGLTAERLRADIFARRRTQEKLESPERRP